jgi:RNA polymerase sigma-70 factor (ECF subfamily)
MDVGPEAIAQHNERLERVRQAVRGLRSEEQEVFLLRQNGQLKYEEIAETVGIPLGTVKTRMRLALTKLRESLAEGE